MRLWLASCSRYRSLTWHGDARTTRHSSVLVPSRPAAALAAVSATLVVLVTVAEPARSATPDTSAAALAGPSETLGGDPGTPGVPTLAAPAPPPQPVGSAHGSTSLPPVYEAASGAVFQAPDTALGAAVSSVVPQNAAFQQPLEAADSPDDSGGAVAAAAPTTVPGGRQSPFTSDSGPSTGVPVQSSAGGLAPDIATHATRPAAYVPQPRVAENDPTQYRAPAAQYQLRNAATDFASANAIPHSRDASSNPSRIHPSIPRHICVRVECERRDIDIPDARGSASRSGDIDETPSPDPDPEVAPIADAPVTSVPEAIGGDEGCGNTNISVRISSPGDDEPVSQVAPTGDCGLNTNISVRINSPGDNGPVSQTIGVAAPSEQISDQPARGLATRPLLDLADAGSGLPRAGADPTTLPGRLDRRAHKLAWALVARGQAKAGLLPQEQAAPRKHLTKSKPAPEGGAFRRVRPAAGSSDTLPPAGSVAAPQSQPARSRPVRPHRRPPDHAAKSTGEPAATRALSRLVSPPAESASRAADADGSGFGVKGMLIAFLAALAASYLLIPPMRAGGGAAPSLLDRSRRALLRR
jgi:hypothetical protein